MDIKESSAYPDILKNIDNYNDELLVSQVIIFFKRHNIEFTKSMIQNYVKMGLIPPSAGNRRYTRNHLLLLTLVNALKEVYSLEEIKKLLAGADNFFKPEELYRLFMSLHTEALEEFCKIWDSFGQERLRTLIDVTNLKNMDEDKAEALILLLTLPTYSKIIKNIIKALWNNI